MPIVSRTQRVPSCLLSLATLALTTLAVLSSQGAAHAQANLRFSGGSGTPLTITLAAPITYTITTAALGAGNAPYFLIQGVGNLIGGGGAGVTVTTNITLRINGGAALSLTNVASGGSGGAVTPSDLITFGSSALPGVNVGDVVTLSAGSMTTTTNVASAAPGTGSFVTFITGVLATRISGNGIASPEPGTLALLALGTLACTGGIVARRRNGIFLQRRKA